MCSDCLSLISLGNQLKHFTSFLQTGLNDCKLDGAAAGQTWPGQEQRQSSQVLLSQPKENSSRCWLIFQPSHSVNCSVNYSPRISPPSLSPLTPTFSWICVQHLPWSTNNNKIKKFSPISTAPRTDSSEGWLQHLEDKAEKHSKSWMSELVVIIREQLQLKYPAGEGWTCSKSGIVEVFVTKYKSRMDQQ